MNTSLIFDLLKASFGEKVLKIDLNDQPQSIEITAQENRNYLPF